MDRILAGLKWPVAVLAVVLLPGVAWAFLALLLRMAAAPMTMAMFAVGCSLYLLLWWNLFRYTRFALLLTLEHELTHALFAWLTFHRVVGLRVTATRGGSVSYVGRGNWLIVIAPYFFPTISVLLVAVFSFIPVGVLGLADSLIGASLAYHVTSTLRETHLAQTDFKKVGYLFAGAFLPTANLASLAAVLSFCHGGVEDLVRFTLSIGQPYLTLFR